MSRRRVIQSAAVATAGLVIDPALRAAVYAQGSDKPEKEEVRIGFIPLTDCASVVMASVLGFDKKYGVKIIPTKEASWAGVRDKLVNGELDMAHVLYGLIYGVHLGVGGPKKDMAVLMTLNNNGQAITLSKALADKGVDQARLADVGATGKGNLDPVGGGQELQLRRALHEVPRLFAQLFHVGAWRLVHHTFHLLHVVGVVGTGAIHVSGVEHGREQFGFLERRALDAALARSDFAFEFQQCFFGLRPLGQDAHDRRIGRRGCGFLGVVDGVANQHARARFFVDLVAQEFVGRHKSR